MIIDDMKKDADEFFRAADKFIKSRKGLHEICTCGHCGMIIEPDEAYKDVDGTPYHVDCFNEIMKQGM